MLPKNYVDDVKRNLYLPPRIRRQELKLLEEEIKEGLDEGRNIQHVEQWMDAPENTAAQILSRHPAYHRSNFLVLAHMMFFGGWAGIWHFIQVDDELRRQKFFRETDFFLGDQYILTKGDEAIKTAEAAELAAAPTFTQSLHSLSPAEGFVLFGLIIVVAVVLWRWLLYVPESKD